MPRHQTQVLGHSSTAAIRAGPAGRAQRPVRPSRAVVLDRGRGPDDAETFAERWRAIADAWSFDEVNDLIDRHNRFFPAEARLPMDPRTRDFVLVNGKPYWREPLGAAWILERFPPELELIASAVD